MDNDTLGALPGGAEAAEAVARAAAAFDGSDRLVAVAVYARESGITEADRAAVEAHREALARYAEGEVPPAVASTDGEALLLSFPLAGDTTAQEAAAEGVRDVVAGGVPEGLQAAMTTLLPSLLVLCGRWLFRPFIPGYEPDAADHDVAEDHGVWVRVARVVGRRPAC